MLLGAGAVIWFVVLSGPEETEPAPTYSEFISQGGDGEVEVVRIKSDENTIEVEPVVGDSYETAYPDNTEQSLINTLEQEGVQLEVE